MSITYTVEKKESALIIHSAMETGKYTIIRNFISLWLCPFSKILHPPWNRARYTAHASDGKLFKYETKAVGKMPERPERPPQPLQNPDETQSPRPPQPVVSALNSEVIIPLR